jgi:hypothetical protein
MFLPLRQTDKSHRVLFARSSDLNLHDFYLWGNLKNKMSLDNTHTLDEFKHNIYETIASVKVSELKTGVMRSFKGLEVCLRVERHFELPLWIKFF